MSIERNKGSHIMNVEVIVFFVATTKSYTVFMGE